MSRLPERIFVGLDSSSPTCGVEVLKAHDRQSYGLTEYVRADIHAAALAAEKEKVRELVEALKFYQAASYPVATRLNSYGLGWRESHLSDAHKEAETLIEKYKEEPNA